MFLLRDPCLGHGHPCLRLFGKVILSFFERDSYFDSYFVYRDSYSILFVETCLRENCRDGNTPPSYGFVKVFCMEVC